MRSRLIVALAVAACLVTGGVSAQSKPPEASGDKALAESLFREARALALAGKLAAACEKFAESLRLEQKLGTLLHLATCHEQTGKLASAWAEYEQAAALAARSKEPERQRLAAERARQLEPKLARVRIVLGAPAADLELRLDGRKLGTASIDVALPVDPGPHVLEASAPNKQLWRGEISAVAATTTDVTVPALDAVVAPAAPTPAPAPAPLPEPGPAIAPLTIVLGAVSVVGLGVGSAFGITFLSQRSEGLDECDDKTCSARGLQRLDDARSSSLLSGIGFGVGAAALAGAVIVHVSGVGRGPRTTISAGPTGVRVGTSW